MSIKSRILRTVTQPCSRAPRSSEQGLTFLESLVAAVIFTISISALGNAFIGQRIKVLSSAINTGAAVAAQQVADNLRQVKVSDMPSSGTVVMNNATTNPRSVLGYAYGTEITYCPSGSVVCTDSTRQVRIQVKFSGKIVYAVDTVYTNLQRASEG